MFFKLITVEAIKILNCNRIDLGKKILATTPWYVYVHEFEVKSYEEE